MAHRLSTDNQPVTFANTVEPLVGIWDAFEPVKNLMYVESSDSSIRDGLGSRTILRIAELESAILKNEHIFTRISELYFNRNRLRLTSDQQAVLTDMYLDFLRSGQSMPIAVRERIAELRIYLAAIENAFSERVLPPEIDFLNDPSFKVSRMNDDRAPGISIDDLILSISKKRDELARLSGFKDFSESVIKDHFLESRSNVIDFIERLAEYYRAWEKLDSKDRVIFPNHDISSYFELDRVIEGAFLITNELFGVQFRARPDIKTWDQSISVYEAIDSDGTYLGMLFLDALARPDKSRYDGVAAYCSCSFPKGQISRDDFATRPIVGNTHYFTSESYFYYKGIKRESRNLRSDRVLLSVGQVRAFYHELGHAVHALVTKARFRSLAGIHSRATDAKEMIAVVFEKLAFEPVHLRRWAKHWKTSEPIKERMISEIQMRNIPDASDMLQRLYLGQLDLELHSSDVQGLKTLADFGALQTKTQMKISGRADTYPSPTTYLENVFGSRFDYASSNYTHLLARVLATRVVEIITDHEGRFDETQSRRFRREIMESPGSELVSRCRAFIGNNLDLDGFLRKETEIRTLRRTWRNREFWKFIVTTPASPLIEAGKMLFGFH